MTDPSVNLIASIEAALATFKATAPVEVTTFPEQPNWARDVYQPGVSPNQNVTYPEQPVSPNLNRVPENAVEAAAMAASSTAATVVPVETVTETKLV